MDVFPKFIIETDDEYGDCLIIARCTYHKELATDKTKVKGGGMWSLVDNTFILSGSSQDFGAADFEVIKQCIKNGNVFSNSSLAFPMTDRHDFAYDTGSEIIKIEKE